MQINRVRLPVTPFPVSLYRFFFCLVSLFNTISPLGVFFCILTADPAVHALRSIYILSLSSEFYFGKGLSLVFYDNRNLKISKSKKSEQYKIEMFIRLCDEHFACHFEVTDARRDVIPGGELYHRFPWRHFPPLPPPQPLLAFPSLIHIFRYLKNKLKNVNMYTM